MNIEKDLAVNLNALDEMVKDQPVKLMQYSDALAEAKQDLGNLELQLSVRTAQVEKMIRKGDYPPAKEAKITEGTVKAFLADDESLIKMQQDIISQKALVGKLTGAVDAFQHRKHSINNAITLFINNYYADNFKPKEPAAKAAERAKQIRGEMS